MGKLITLDEYYNRVGKEKYSDWSDEIIYYHSERRKEFKHLRERANEILAKATNQIWEDGKVKVSARLEQGYFDPAFAIEDFDFVQSLCYDRAGNPYHCKIELIEENRGRPRKYDFIRPLIVKYVEKHYLSKGLPLAEISADAVINDIGQSVSKIPQKSLPHPNTVRKYLLEIYPECKKTSRNSKK